ncbi:MAG TPA: stage II sporulation protein M [Lachnospiraceae bacterium]|nr:stage II sporulation protein M [Lachnospiraceae bacterium]
MVRNNFKTFRIHLGVYRTGAIILVIGLLIGTVCANLLQDYYINDMDTINKYFNNNVNRIAINYGSLLKYIVAKHVKEFFLIWVCCCTVFGIPFLGLLVGYQGFCIGFTLSSSIICYGLKGILHYAIYTFPQCAIYIPVYILAMKKGFELCEKFYYSGRVAAKGRRNVVLEYAPIILILLFLLLIGCIIETYINSYFVRQTINWFQ